MTSDQHHLPLFTSSPYFPLSCGRQLSWQIPPHRSDGEKAEGERGREEIERQVKHASVERALPGDAVIMPGGVSEREREGQDPQYSGLGFSIDRMSQLLPEEKIDCLTLDSIHN